MLVRSAIAMRMFDTAEALKSIPPLVLAEIFGLFPELANSGHIPASARHIPAKGRQMRTMVDRHLRNERPLIDAV